MDEYPGYIFHLDAQTVVLEDYLEIRPEERERIGRLVAEGRLRTGPWYVQGDFHLVSGEAIVRNLVIGTRMAEEFGLCSRAGYVPDQFGLCSQLPQILRGFGIDNAIFGRGFHQLERTPEGEVRSTHHENEFWWETEDGSRVLGLFMRHWYTANRGQAPPRTDAPIVPACASRAAEPVPALPRTGTAELAGRADGKPLGRFAGELRHGGEGHTLPGTLSSCVYIKIDNVRAHALLENQLEPLYAMTGMAGGERLWPGGYLRYLWKLLVVNHAHDSICGCSCDTVYLNMLDRYLRIQACGQDLVKRGMRWLAERLDRSALKPDQYVLIAANTLTCARTETLTVALTFPEDECVSQFRIMDSDGADVPFETVARNKKMLTILSPINLPGLIRADEVTVRFVARVEGMAWRSWTIVPHEKAIDLGEVYGSQTGDKQLGWARSSRSGLPATCFSVTRPLSSSSETTPQQTEPSVCARADDLGSPAGPIVINNGILRLEIAGTGAVNLRDLRNDTEIHDMLALEDESDFGHSYIH